MPISVTCPGCKGQFNAPDHLAGKRVKCPKCATVLEVAAPQPTGAPSATPIAVACACGRQFRVKPDLAGKRVKCPGCGQVLTVPGPAPASPLAPSPLADPTDMDRLLAADAAAPTASPLGPTPKRKKKRASNSRILIGLSIGAGVVVVVALLTMALWPSGDGPSLAGGTSGSPTAGASAGPSQPITLDAAFPDGVSSPPEWLVRDAPFDMESYFEAPAPEYNGATLYLDALYEFGPRMGVCFSSSERSKRESAVRQRRQRLDSLFSRLEEMRVPRDPNMLAQLAGEYDIGFEKLANAQRYPQCVFQTGIDVISGNDINEAAFQVGRALQLRAHDHLARGEIDRIIDELEIVLRLGRDLCRRTAMFLQTASSGLIRVACEEVVPMVLASSDLTAEHCQRLIALLESIDYSTHWYRRSIDGEYVCARTFLHNLKSDQGPFQLTSTPRREVVGLFNEILRVRNGEHLYQAFKAAPDKRYREEIDELNRWHTSISRTGDGSLQEQIAALKTYDRKGMVSPQIIPHYVRALSLEPVAHAFMRGRARIAGTQCLLALRHWQLTRDQDISSLDEVVRAAGMKETPRDPFGNGSLQMTMLRGHRVIYSVGHDGIDNHGEPEYGEDARTRRGDIVFRLPKPQ